MSYPKFKFSQIFDNLGIWIAVNCFFIFPAYCFVSMVFGNLSDRPSPALVSTQMNINLAFLVISALFLIGFLSLPIIDHFQAKKTLEQAA